MTHYFQSIFCSEQAIRYRFGFSHMSIPKNKKPQRRHVGTFGILDLISFYIEDRTIYYRHSLKWKYHSLWKGNFHIS
jgi:hypothetical protein